MTLPTNWIMVFLIVCSIVSLMSAYDDRQGINVSVIKFSILCIIASIVVLSLATLPGGAK